MRPVLAITHLSRYTKIGLAESELREQGLELLTLDMFGGEDWHPELGDVSAVMSFGGQMSVTEIDRYPFLCWELELMKRALADDVPVLGMCLGGQLLALASGGDVERMGRPYVGWPELRLRPGSRDDPLFSLLTNGLPVLKWHHDAIVPSSEDSIVADTDSPGCAVFRPASNAWGSQMHLETTPDILFEEWLTDPLELAALRHAGSKPEAFRAEAEHRLPRQIEAMRPLFGRFAEVVSARES